MDMTFSNCLSPMVGKLQSAAAIQGFRSLGRWVRCKPMLHTCCTPLVSKVAILKDNAEIVRGLKSSSLVLLAGSLTLCLVFVYAYVRYSQSFAVRLFVLYQRQYLGRRTIPCFPLLLNYRLCAYPLNYGIQSRDPEIGRIEDWEYHFRLRGPPRSHESPLLSFIAH